MEFLQLEYFLHASKTENFSHTAGHFMVPPSSISLTVKKLEEELGTKLFDRYGNSIKLNEKGRIFANSVKNIFDELNSAKNNLNKLRGIPTGTIRMLVLTNRRIITEIIARFRQEYPDVSFVIDLYKKEEYISYDIIITDSHINSEAFYKKDFISEEIRLAVPLSSSISLKKQITMRELKDEKFISLSPNHSLRDITSRLCAEAGFSPNIVIECDDPFYVREYVKMGMGVSLIPILSWKNQFDDSVALLRVNNGEYRSSMAYLNVNSSFAAEFFEEYMYAIRPSIGLDG